MISDEIETRGPIVAAGTNQVRVLARAGVLMLCMVLSACSMLDGAEEAEALFQRQLQGDSNALVELEALGQRKSGTSAFYAGLAFDRRGDSSKALHFYALSDSKYARHNAAVIQIRQLKQRDFQEPGTEWLSNLNAAAEAGVPESMLFLAKIYERGSLDIQGNPALTYQWVKRLVEHNKDPEAEYLLGLAYLNGFGTARDEIQAKRYLESSAKSGYSQAMVALYRLNSGFDRLVWLLIAVNTNTKNVKLLSEENLANYNELDIKKAKEKSLAWVNAHSTKYEPLKYDHSINPIH